MLNQFLFKSYRFFYLWETWWRRRFTNPGLFVFSIIIISALLGIDTTRNMIYQIFTFSSVLLLISMLYALFFKADFKVKRELPKFVTVNQKFHYRIEIKNLTGKFQKDLFLFENPKDPRPDLEELLSAREPGEEKRNLWDRKIMYYRWLWLIRQNQKAWFGENIIPDILPDGIVSFNAELTPGNRGYIQFSGVIIARPDPFGLFMAFKRIDCIQKLLVLPRRYSIPEMHLPGTRNYHSGGVTLASAVGNSEEFVSLREFRPGDPIRNIHWKSWAKTDNLIIREFQDEYFTRHALILDTYHDQAHSDIFEEAISVASSFAGSIKAEEAILDLMFVGNQAYCFSSGRGLSTSEKIMEILACIQTVREKNISEILPLIEEYAPLLSGSICIFLKWDKHRQTIFDRLKATGSPCLAMVVTDNKELCLEQLQSYSDEVYILESGRIQEGLMQL